MNKIHAIPTLSDNYTYVVEGDGVLLVDCGDAAPVVDFLHQCQLTPGRILCTHHHDDHIAGLQGLKAAFPKLEIYAPEKDFYRIPDAKFGLSDQQVFEFSGCDFTCIETRGHTQNHLCFYSAELKSVFTGDALFSMGCGRLFEGTPQDMFDALQKLKTLPDETLIYCGHEYTVRNGEFCLTVEPDNEKIRERLLEAKNLRSGKKPTLPVTLRKEKETNVFLQAETVDNIAHMRRKRDVF